MSEPRDALTLLRLFREFHSFYVTQSKIGAGHAHPLWGEIAEALGDANHQKMTDDEYRFITSPYWDFQALGHKP